jgi:hypothetical protein
MDDGRATQGKQTCYVFDGQLLARFEEQQDFLPPRIAESGEYPGYGQPVLGEVPCKAYFHEKSLFCLIAKITSIFFADIFAGSSAEKYAFQATYAAFGGAKPWSIL